MTVFVVQSPMRWRKGELVEVFDLSPAKEYSEDVRILFESTASPFDDPEAAIDMLYQALKDYNGERDYIICTGNPIMSGWAISIASVNSPNFKVTCLHWNSHQKKYLPVTAEMR